MSESTTENQMDGTIESAVESIIAPSEEPIAEIVEEEIEVVDTEDSEIEDEVDSDETEEDEDYEDNEESDSADDEDQIEDASPEEPRYAVKVNGTEVEVSLEDLKQGYSGQQYVQQGMQDAAAQKKEAEAVYTALNNERAKMAQLYQQLQTGGVTQPPAKPTKDLFDADPIGYMQKNIEYEEQKTAYDNQMAQLQQIAQQSSAAETNAKNAYLQEQMQILQKEVPAFADPKKASRLREQLVTTGKNHYGYSNDEISNITDARAIKVLNDAMRYQDILSGKSKAVVKTKSARPVMKPGAKKIATPNAKKRSRQQAKLRDSGDMKDALELILNT